MLCLPFRDQKINAFGVPVGPVPVPGAAGVIEASAEQPPQKQPMPGSEKRYV